MKHESDPARGRAAVLQRASEEPARDPIQGLLARLTRHLDVDVCFVGEVRDGQRAFRYLEGDGASFGFEAGGSDPLEETLCGRVLDGTVPRAMPDARRDPVAGALPVTHQARIGAYLGVPIVLPSGRLYGTLCATSHDPQHDLDARDLAALELASELIADHLAERAGPELVDPSRVAAVLADPGALLPVFQPVIELATGRTVGFEALARFRDAPPQQMFDDAWRTGFGEQLELLAVERALAQLDDLPYDAWLSVNASPRTVLSPAFSALLREVPNSRIVVEITEHAVVSSYPEVAAALEHMLDAGVRLAVDDVGSGYATLQHIVELSPDILKLDAAFARGVHEEPARRALIAAFVGYAREIDAQLIVEGIETEGELGVLCDVGVGLGQGFHLGRPAPVQQLLRSA